MRPSEIEQIKLLANSIDRAATSCFTVGIVTPAAGLIYNFANFGSTVDVVMLVMGVVVWTIVGVGLHYQARQVLLGLDR